MRNTGAHKGNHRDQESLDRCLACLPSSPDSCLDRCLALDFPLPPLPFPALSSPQHEWFLVVLLDFACFLLVSDFTFVTFGLFWFAPRGWFFVICIFPHCERLFLLCCSLKLLTCTCLDCDYIGYILGDSYRKVSGLNKDRNNLPFSNGIWLWSNCSFMQMIHLRVKSLWCALQCICYIL